MAWRFEFQWRTTTNICGWWRWNWYWIIWFCICCCCRRRVICVFWAVLFHLSRVFLYLKTVLKRFSIVVCLSFYFVFYRYMAYFVVFMKNKQQIFCTRSCFDSDLIHHRMLCFFVTHTLIYFFLDAKMSLWWKNCIMR